VTRYNYYCYMDNEAHNLNFKLFHTLNIKTLKAKRDDGKVPVSSSNFDRDNDRMTEQFMVSMAEQINTGHVALYADHGWDENGIYSVFSKLGYWSEAEVQDGLLYAKPVFSDAKAVQDKVEKLQDLIGSNTPVTWSIAVVAHKWADNDKDGYDYKEGDLVEISAVGLPANPDAVSSYQKALYKHVFDTYNTEAKNMTEEQKEIETLEDALNWLQENAPEAVVSLISEAVKEEEEPDEEEDQEESDEEKGEDEEEPDEEEPDEDEDEEEKALTRAEVKDMIAEALKGKKELPPPPKKKQADQEPEEKPKATPKGRGPKPEDTPEQSEGEGALKKFEY